MAKLYWRIKKDGKWTWKPVRVHTVHAEEGHFMDVTILKEEEE